jgi:sulfonate transport system permease protein
MSVTLPEQERQQRGDPAEPSRHGRSVARLVSRRRGRTFLTKRFIIGAVSVGIFLMLWELNRWVQLIDPDFITSPTVIVRAFPDVVSDELLTKHGPATVYAVLLGFLPAVVVGVLVGSVVGASKRLTYLFEPLIMAFYITPRIALIPLFIIWLGIGLESKIAIVFVSGVFPVLMNSLAGVKGVEPVWVRAGVAFGATRWQTIWRTVLPGATPSIMTGIRLGWGRALIGVIVGEMYVSLAGMGKLIRTYQNAVSTESLFVVIVLITIFGFLGIRLIAVVEKRVSPWSEGLKW